ncbi:uncharacterized protein LOC134026882 [Osmerus eperlanus]|uniref:uncharacterized protein LOC134026882 n=1 Tax=Osmerus eperlanus TaxID=29151 RepID=UPI002E0D44DF
MEGKWEAIYNLLSGGSYPSGYTKAQRQTIRRSSLNFALKDGVLFRKSHGGLCKVLRTEEEIREVLTQYHDNNDHAGQKRMLKSLNRMYHWGGMCPAINTWIKNCETCKNKPVYNNSSVGNSFRCIAYGCESSSVHQNDGTTFHRFPRDSPERMDLWVALAQRDRWSIGSNVYLCSKHFTDDCFESSEEGLVLKPDAVPTIAVALPLKEEPLFQESETDDHSLEFGSLEELISASNDTLKREEHQYDAMEHYLSTGRYFKISKAVKGSIRRQSKGFILTGGVLMNNQRPALRRVLRSREEVVNILKQFHNDRGHKGMSYSYASMSKQYFWGTMTRDLADWIANCDQCCVDRESRKHMCSVYKCNNYSGPVERGLGITFHPFPIHKPHLLDCWVKAMGRPSWFPRPRSVVCSGHFTEDCFDRSGDTVVLKPDAVPSMFLYQQPVQQSPSISKKVLALGLNEFSQGTTSDQAFFAKYDVVDRYIRENIYPSGLSSVEKNTIRRFCKKFIIKDGLLHIMIKSRVLKVLRSQEEVNEALAEFHDELNHLNLKKCMRLLTERYFWGTMEVDVARWIENCSECSEAPMELEQHQEPATGVTQPNKSWQNNTDLAPISPHSAATGIVCEDDIADWVEDCAEISASTKKALVKPKRRPGPASGVLQPVEPEDIIIDVIPFSPHRSSTVSVSEHDTWCCIEDCDKLSASMKKALVEPDQHQEAGIGIPSYSPESSASVNAGEEYGGHDVHNRDVRGEKLQPVPTNAVMQMVLFSQQQNKVVLVRGSDLEPIQLSQPQPQVQILPQSQPQPQVQILSQSQPQPQVQILSQVQAQPATPTSSQPQPLKTQTWPQTRYQTRNQTRTQTQGRGSEQVANGNAKLNLKASIPPPQSSAMLQASPPMSTVRHRTVMSPKVPSARSVPKVPSSRSVLSSPKAPPSHKSTTTACNQAVGLQARTVIQQCSQALLKISPVVDGAEAKWVQIQDGMVVYVCFFKGATEEIIPKMVETLLETKLFRKSNGQMVSVLKLPGSVLLIPQDTLTGNSIFMNRVMYPDVAQPRRGAQLYSQLVTGCEKAMNDKLSTDSEVGVKHGTYGNKQEILINSQEPATLLLEF